MKLFGDQYPCVAGVFLWSLVGWVNPSQAQSQASEGNIWSQLQQADSHYYVLMRHALAPGTDDRWL